MADTVEQEDCPRCGRAVDLSQPHHVDQFEEPYHLPCWEEAEQAQMERAFERSFCY